MYFHIYIKSYFKDYQDELKVIASKSDNLNSTPRPSCGSREPIPAKCPLASTHTHLVCIHACTHGHTNMHTNPFKYMLRIFQSLMLLFTLFLMPCLR